MSNEDTPKKDRRFIRGTREHQRFEAQKASKAKKAKTRYRKAMKVEVINETGIHCDVEKGAEEGKGGWLLSWDDQDLGLMLEVVDEEWFPKKRRVKVWIDFKDKDLPETQEAIETFKNKKIEQIRKMREEDESDDMAERDQIHAEQDGGE